MTKEVRGGGPGSGFKTMEELRDKAQRGVKRVVRKTPLGMVVVQHTLPHSYTC